MKQTPLYQVHLSLNARMVDFAGWEMPLHYQDGINQEHLAVRTQAGLFDVSHMGEIRVLGPDAISFLRYSTLNDPARLKPGHGQYSMVPNGQGGLIDDIYLYRDGENAFLIVCNAANTRAVVGHLKNLAHDFDCHVVDESATWALLALQGPGSALMLGRQLPDDLTGLRKNRSIETAISGCDVKISRTGYTGEDGFEIFCHPLDATIIWDILMTAGAKPCGLGSRDTLRLEAGFPLYGHELTTSSNPLCTPYHWVVKDKPFFGREIMWNRPCERQLVALRLNQRGVARQGYKILVGDKHIGEVTSGTISPLSREGIAMGWITSSHATPGNEVGIEIRGQQVPATIVTPPFYQP